MSKGYLVATFDLLNVRDLDVIEQATARCDHLVVGVFSDDLVEQLLGRRPVVPADERVRLVANVRGVDHVRVHEVWSDDLESTVFALRDDIDLLGTQPVVILDSRRESTSDILRAALSPADMQAVA
jgi:cytidyltransferase-like protein